jgi:hypothetical protein
VRRRFAPTVAAAPLLKAEHQRFLKLVGVAAGREAARAVSTNGDAVPGSIVGA